MFVVAITGTLSQLRAVHEQLAALSQGPIVKPKKKKEKKKKKKLEKRSRGGRSRAGSEEWKMPGKMMKSKSGKAAGSQAKKAQGKKSNKNSKLVGTTLPTMPLCSRLPVNKLRSH